VPPSVGDMTTGPTHEDGARHDDGLRHDEAAPRIRAADADRAATVEVLKDAVARGLLTPDEGSERMASAFAARYTDELPALSADLPAIAAPATAPVTATGWRQLGATLGAQLRSDVGSAVAAGPRSRRFLLTLLVAVLLVVVLVALGGAALQGLLDGGHGEHFGGGGH
jgi:hypothetical protein